MQKLIGCWLLVVACTSSEKPAGVQGVARVVTTMDEVVVVLTAEDNSARIDDVLAGSKPQGFHWKSFRIPLSQQETLSSGATFDLRDPKSNIVFTQMYRETCNPAKEDFTPCWIYENYTSGEPGLTGFVTLRITPKQVFGTYDVSWEGLTDRFGDPIQYCAHQTLGNIVATLLQGATN